MTHGVPLAACPPVFFGARAPVPMGLGRALAASCQWHPSRSLRLVEGAGPLYIGPMRGDVERVLISQDRIALRVHELARQITEDHRLVIAGGDAELTIVPILTGAMIFCADLIRHIPMAMKIGLMAVTSYPGRSVRTQASRVIV